MKGVLGKLLLVTAFFACPCHLPIYAALFGGTALGAFWGGNKGLAALFFTAFFLATLVAGLSLVGQSHQGMDQKENRKRRDRAMRLFE